MSLEVRQMVVTSSVVQRQDGGGHDRDAADRADALKQEILDEVRRRLRAALDDPRER